MKNISAWITRRLGPTRLSGDELIVCCPYCDDTAGHMYYNQRKNVFNCFKCNTSGQGLDLIMFVDRVNALTAAQFLSPSRLNPPKASPKLSELPGWYKPLLPEPDEPIAGYRQVLNYTLARGFTESQINFYSFGYAQGDYKHRSRLIIPVERGYFQARATTKIQKPKYLNPDSPKENRLFNYRFLGASRLAICEGVISAIAASTPDCPAVAILGKKALPEQMKRITDSKPVSIEIAFDAGTETDDSTMELAQYFYSYDIFVHIRSYKFGDPDECSEYTLYRYSPTYRLKSKLLRVK